MHVVLVHRSGSGQFAQLSARLVAEGAEVTLITERAEAAKPGIRQIIYAAGQASTTRTALAATDYHLRTGEAVAAELARLRVSDPPDIVIGHIGWGGLLFARDTLPGVPLIGYCEYYYNVAGSDLDFDPTSSIDDHERRRIRMRNAAQLLTLETLDGAYAPTRWQQRQYPQSQRQRIAILHDGVDTSACRPDSGAMLTLPDGREIKKGDPVVTYVARDLDPYRGYPQFMRMAKIVGSRLPDAIFVAVGGDGSGYGRARSDGQTWRDAMIQETGLGERVVHIPWLAHARLVRLFQISAAHVYLSVPFVLSWSLLEAMACGCLIVGSSTPPVREVIRDGYNGLLAPFYDEETLAERVLEALDQRASLAKLRFAARDTVLRYFELNACLDSQIALITELISRCDALA